MIYLSRALRPERSGSQDQGLCAVNMVGASVEMAMCSKEEVHNVCGRDGIQDVCGTKFWVNFPTRSFAAKSKAREKEKGRQE